MNSKSKAIVDTHQQLRDATCFQMAPELALKLAGILQPNDYPFQSVPKWDGKGYEPCQSEFENSDWIVNWECTNTRFFHPYGQLVDRLRAEIAKGNFPVLSLVPPRGNAYHGYVAIGVDATGDVVVVTKMGSVESPPCSSVTDSLRSRTTNQLPVDCCFWRAMGKLASASRMTNAQARETAAVLASFLQGNVSTFSDITVLEEGIGYHYTPHADLIVRHKAFLGAPIDLNLASTQSGPFSRLASDPNGVVFAYPSLHSAAQEGLGVGFEILRIRYRAAVQVMHQNDTENIRAKGLFAGPQLLIVANQINAVENLGSARKLWGEINQKQTP